MAIYTSACASDDKSGRTGACADGLAGFAPTGGLAFKAALTPDSIDERSLASGTVCADGGDADGSLGGDIAGLGSIATSRCRHRLQGK